MEFLPNPVSRAMLKLSSPCVKGLVGEHFISSCFGSLDGKPSKTWHGFWKCVYLFIICYTCSMQLIADGWKTATCRTKTIIIVH